MHVRGRMEGGGVEVKLNKKREAERREIGPSQECEAAGIRLKHRGVRQRGGQMERKQRGTGKQLLQEKKSK